MYSAEVNDHSRGKVMSKSVLREVASQPQETSKSDAISAEASREFVESHFVKDITHRGLLYLEAGYPLHLSGPAGTGKTTLAFHIAAQLGQPVILIHGDDEIGSSDLIGQETGFKRSKVIDNYIHSVKRTEEEYKTNWVENRLTTACINGYTLVYDEFTRSRPEANNSLLSILEEKILDLPKLRRQGDGYIEVHPQFRAIFTSNPDEYVGVHKMQDALMDRLITIRVEHFNRETEIDILVAKSNILREDASRIIDIVRELRKIGVNNSRPTIRAGIAVARVVSKCGIRAESCSDFFRQICHDIFDMDTANVTKDGKPLMTERVEDVIRGVC